MLQVHAAVAAGLTPVTLGPGALAALMAYAHGACGGRLLIIHVSPSALQTRDLDEAPGGGLVAATAAARDIDGLSLVVLEGANRSPLEGSVVPLLQLMSVGLSPLAPARGLRLSATLVAGATTVPISPQLWSYATAIIPSPVLRARSPRRAPAPSPCRANSSRRVTSRPLHRRARRVLAGLPRATPGVGAVGRRPHAALRQGGAADHRSAVARPRPALHRYRAER